MPKGGKQCQSYLQEGQKGGADRSVSFTSIPQKVLEHVILETISRLRKEKKIVSMDSTKGSFGKWQHFYNEIPSLMGEEGSSGGPGGH